MHALTSSLKRTTCRRFANMVFNKADVKVSTYSSHAFDMKLSDNALTKIRDTTPNLPFHASSIFSVNSRRYLNPHTTNLSTAVSSSVGDNTSATTTTVLPVHNSGSRGVAKIGEGRKKETNISVKINLNGTGVADSDSGIPFLDKMIHEFASQGLFDVHVKATCNIDVDKRVTNEDVGHAIGMALQDAVGDNEDIRQFGSFFAPHHDALIHAAIEFPGFQHLDFDSDLDDFSDEDDTYDIHLLEPFFESLVNESGMSLHLRLIQGSNSRHIIEAIFKAFAGALRQATEYDPHRRRRSVQLSI